MAWLNTMLRKGAVFTWTEQCNNVFKLLKSELVKMPTLQYPNPNKPFKLFTDASKHSYSGILYQEETPGKPGAEANLIPIAYFSGSFGRTQQPWNTSQKESYAVAQFFTTGMSSPVLTDGPLNFNSSTSSLNTSKARRIWLPMQYLDSGH